MDTRHIYANTIRLIGEIDKCFDIKCSKKDYSEKHLPRIKILIDNGVDLTFLWDGLTPTLLAACYQLWDIVALIANTRKMPEKVKFDIYEYNKCLLNAARAGNEIHAYDAAVALINAGAKPVKYHLYMESEAEIYRDCVHWAVINCNMKLLELFLKHTPNLHFKDSKNRTAILVAAEKKYWPLVSLFTKFYVTDAADTLEYGRALCVAVYHGQIMVAQDLLKAGALQNHYLTLQGENNYCLHLAVMRNHAEMLQLLLSYKSNLSRKNGQTAVTGITPLQMALRLLRENCIKVLLAHDHKKMKFNQEEYNSYRKAVKKGKWDIAGMMVCAASGINKVTAKNGNTLLHDIVIGWSELGIWAEDILRYTIKKGAKQTIQNLQNQTPVELAGLLKNWIAVKLLIEANHNDLTPSRIMRLHYEKVLQQAIQDENSDIVRLLLEQGSPCNESDLQKGNIALYLTVKINNSQILRLLLKHGADVSQTDKDGATIYDLAEREGGSSCIRVLDERRALALVHDTAKSSFMEMGFFSHAKSPPKSPPMSPPKSPPVSPPVSPRASKNKHSNSPQF